MIVIHPDILAQLTAKELRPAQLLKMTIGGSDYCYTDCDVPIGLQFRAEAITGGPTVHGLSLADGAAFVRLNGFDLTPFAGVAGVRTPCKLTLTDSAGKVAYGWMAEADVAEALGSELLNNPGFTDWTGDDPDLWAIHDVEDGNNYVTESAEKARIVSTDGVKAIGIYQVCGTTPGKLYEVSFDITTYGSGTFQIWLRGPGGWGDPALTQNITSSGVKTFYATAESTHVNLTVMLFSSGIGDLTVDDFSFKEVTDCGTDGVHIVSARNGSTRNWESIEAGFDYNDAAYTVTITDARYEPRGFSHDGAKYSTGRIVDKVTLDIDNLDETLSAAFYGGEPQGGAVELGLSLLDSSREMVGAPIVWFSGTVDDWSGDEERLRISVVGPNYAWSRRNTGRHPSSCRWTVFKGTECAYAGAAAACNRSYTRCVALGVSGNFGGFRWLPSIENKEISWGRKA